MGDKFKEKTKALFAEAKDKHIHFFFILLKNCSKTELLYDS